MSESKTIQVSVPVVDEYWGRDVTQSQAERYARSLATLVGQKLSEWYPDADVHIVSTHGGSRVRVNGEIENPDALRISDWIERNWVLAID